MKMQKLLLMCVVLLGTISFISCSDDEPNDNTGGNGNGSDVLMLPVKLYNTDKSANSVIEFEYDSENRVKGIIEKRLINNEFFKSETTQNITITYGNSANRDEAITDIYCKRVISGTNVVGKITQEEFYEVDYEGSSVGIRLVRSTNDNNTDGTGTALGIIVLELDKNKRVIERKESWEDGLVALHKYTYDTKGNITEDRHGNSANGGEITTMVRIMEYDDKYNIYHAVNAPRWIGDLPLGGTVSKEVNNVTKLIASDANMENINTTTSVYEYNSDDYPVKYINKSSDENIVDSEWIIEYRKIN